MSPGRVLQVDLPFMNNMDEIAYWIHTKRAPCLLNYDNFLTKNSLGHCSKTKAKSVCSAVAEPTPQKRKKRELSMLDDASASTEKQQNVYFQVSQKKCQRTEVSCPKSDESEGSDIDFNIKKSSVQQKLKRTKHHKNSLTTVHRKNKIVTSTPKVDSNLRRSLRRVQQSTLNNSQLQSSSEIFNENIVNDNTSQIKGSKQKCNERQKKSVATFAGGDQDINNKRDVLLSDAKKNVLNREFEDLSDVSGFTANYIRSTKTSRKLRCKSSRNLIKEHRNLEKDKTMVVCASKAVNTGMSKSGALNCSTDSSQNIVNLVTKVSGKTSKVDKSTSLLKFIDLKTTKSKESLLKPGVSSQRSKTANISFQSNSVSRYPKRHQNVATEVSTAAVNNQAAEKKRKISKNSSDFNNSDRKENPDELYISRTRSGRSIGLTLRQADNSVLVLSNSTEQVSSMASMNVATPTQGDKMKKKRHNSRYVNAKKSFDKTGSLRKDSLREKSGFAACFSDSDDDNEPLKQRKFFRA